MNNVIRLRNPFSLLDKHIISLLNISRMKFDIDTGGNIPNTNNTQNA